MIADLKLVTNKILEQYVLPLGGIHGVVHWARVLENGMRLCQETSADAEVISLFAVFHDSRRINESTDPDHGLRGAALAAELRNWHFELSDHQFNLLTRACIGHTTELTHPDITIQTCWDADRLDLGRVGITPHPSRLCTEAAKCRQMINWADGRASMWFVPDLIKTDWGIDLDEPD